MQDDQQRGKHPPDTNEQLPQDLGYPVIVFLDTSIYVSKNFSFDGAFFKALLAGVSAGDVRLVISDITIREVQSQIEDAVAKAQAAIGQFRNQAKIIRQLPAHDLAPVFTDLNWDDTKTQLVGKWKSFLREADAEVLPIDGAATCDIFNDYFSNRPPFGKAKKKHEFPDAFVLKALTAYCYKNSCLIVVVSNDSDFREVCEEHDSLIWCPDLEKVLEHSKRLDALDPARIHALLSQNRSELDAAIIESFVDRGFYWNSDEGHDGNVEELGDIHIESLDVSVVDVADDWVGMAGTVTIQFQSTVQYPDPDMTVRDDETKEWLSFGSRTAELVTTADFPISFIIDVAQLKNGVLEFEDLVVNNDGDVWFSEDEVESITWY